MLIRSLVPREIIVNIARMLFIFPITCVFFSVPDAARASARDSAPMRSNPLVALSAFGTMQSRTAVCNCSFAPSNSKITYPSRRCTWAQSNSSPEPMINQNSILVGRRSTELARGDRSRGIFAILKALTVISGLAAKAGTSERTGNFPNAPD